MAASNPFKTYLPGGRGRNSRRSGLQNQNLSLNIDPNLNGTKFYSIVDNILTLAVVQNAAGYQLFLLDKDKKYIGNTYCHADENVAQAVIAFIEDKNFSGLIRYLKGNSVNEPPKKKLETDDIIINHIFCAAKELFITPQNAMIISKSLDRPSHREISDEELLLPPSSELMKVAEQGELDRHEQKRTSRTVNHVEIIYSGASGSPLYGSPSLSSLNKEQHEKWISPHTYRP